MNSPTAGLRAWTPVARPLFGAVRPFEFLLGFGQMPLVETMFLYWAPDHLLIARRSGTRENYQRLYYRDIQGVRLHAANLQHLGTVIALLISAGLAGLAVYAYSVDAADGMMAAALGSAVALGLGIFNLVLGPLGTCEIITAVDCVPISGIGRWNAGMHFVEELSRRAREAQVPSPPPPEGASPPPLASFGRPLQVPRKQAYGELVTLWHWAYYAMLAAGALISIAFVVVWRLDGLEVPMALRILNSILTVAMIWIGAVALGKQRHPAMDRGLRLWTNAVFVLQALVTAGSYYAAFMVEQLHLSPMDLLSLVLQGFNIVISLLGAGVGTLMLRDLAARGRRLGNTATT